MPDLTPEERADQEAREEEVRRGEESRRLLEHELLQACLIAIEESYRRAWENSQLGDTATREAAYRMLRSCREFRGLLTRLIDTGDIAAEQLAVLIAQQEAEDAFETEPI